MHVGSPVIFVDFVSRENQNLYPRVITVGKRGIIRISANLKGEMILTVVINQKGTGMLVAKFACAVDKRVM